MSPAACLPVPLPVPLPDCCRDTKLDSFPPPLVLHPSSLAALLWGEMGKALARTSGGAGGGGGGRHSHGAHPGLGPAKQHALYKTEMCKGWMENGTCRYGHKCQFAHGAEELRLVPRHPKYKTEVCRSFTLTGSCVYGGRCRFLHAHTSAPNALYGSEGLRLMGTSGDQGAGFGLEEVQVEGNWDTLVSAAQRARMASNLFKQPAVNALSPASGDSLDLHPGLVSHLLRHSQQQQQPMGHNWVPMQQWAVGDRVQRLVSVLTHRRDLLRCSAQPMMVERVPTTYVITTKVVYKVVVYQPSFQDCSLFDLKTCSSIEGEAGPPIEPDQ
ncbi:hypothetical protein V8C86DRAFT_2433010 [Haematococcus lacustris]